MTRPPNCAEALKLALEALTRSRKAVSGDLDLAGCAYGKNDPDGHRYESAKTALVTLDKAVTAAQKALAQPEQVREAYASITIRVGNRYIQQFVTQEMFLSAKEPWWLLDQYAKRCVEKLKESA